MSYLFSLIGRSRLVLVKNDQCACDTAGVSTPRDNDRRGGGGPASATWTHESSLVHPGTS